MGFRPLSLAAVIFAAVLVVGTATVPVLNHTGVLTTYAIAGKNFRYERRTLAHGGAEMPVGTRYYDGGFYRFDHRDELSFVMSYAGSATGDAKKLVLDKIRTLYAGDRIDKITEVFVDPYGAMYEVRGYLPSKKRNFKTRVLVTDGNMWIGASSVKPSRSAKYAPDIAHYLKTFGFYAD
jgi:hypothetical protein